MIDRAIMGVSVVVLLTILALALFLLVLPLFQRLGFDMLCQDWVRRMDAGGGLSSSQLAVFAAELASRGYAVDQLEATAAALFGGTLRLNVRVSRRERRIAPDMTMKEAVVSSSFTRSVICRKIATAAGDPLG